MRAVPRAARDRRLVLLTRSRVMRRWLLTLLAMAACTGDSRTPKADSARGEVSAAADTGMAGMDHSKMPGMATKTAPANAMAGMDHSKMPGMAKTPAPGNAMAGMDHSKMPSMAAKTAPANAMAGMDHSRMPGMATNTAPANAMAGMDHSTMPGMSGVSGAATPPATAADEKLDRLVAGLLSDSIVRQRIQTDTALRRRWDEAARRTLLPSRP